MRAWRKCGLYGEVNGFWSWLRGAAIALIYRQQAAAVYAFMPAAMGVAYWPREGPNVSGLVEIDNLPLPDNSIDRVIALHALEGLAEPDTSAARGVAGDEERRQVSVHRAQSAGIVGA